MSKKYAPRRKITLIDVNNYASEHNGICISKEYVTLRYIMEFQCSKGHIFSNTFANMLKHNSWCPLCTGKAHMTIDQIYVYVQEFGLSCLSTKYTSARESLSWQCNTCSHVWKARLDQIKAGSRCPKCAGKAPYTLSDVQVASESKGGKCLSAVYVNLKTPLEFICSRQHIFTLWPESLFRGSWCSLCKVSKNEKFVRHAFETMIGKDFPSIRPDWLKTDRGHKMELDGFCKEINLAFEAHGRQHYSLSRKFHTEKGYQEQCQRDALKKEMCEALGITLIEIPEVPKMVSLQKLPHLIVSIVKEKRPDITFVVEPENVVFDSVYCP